MKKATKDNFEKIDLIGSEIIAQQLISEMEHLCDSLEISGSIRRKMEQVGDIDLVIIPKNIDNFLMEIKKIIDYDYGGTKKVFGIYKDRPVNIFITDIDSFGACLYQTTGPVFYNIRKRTKVKAMGYKLNEYGVFCNDTGNKVAGESENSIFDFFGWSRKLPELRV